MGRYISNNDVKARLIGKVKFTTKVEDQNNFSDQLLTEYVAQAEAQVEIDLSPRYAAPFQTPAKLPWTQKNINFSEYNIIRNLCQLQAVIRVLETDFGSGGVVGADKYVEKIEARYKSIIEDKLLAKKKLGSMETQQWSYPPLMLLKSYMNRAADDGYMGQILNTTQTQPQYPQFQLNDPSETYWNGIFDDPNYSPTGNSGGGLPGAGNL
jgi:hypothetical protein